ncbi:MAG TPA: hypothetical protein VMQ58_02250, partial [Candidatus Saccharimonadales bacterium]|nr:hypothetical protein [Candidatus Saccharimonadales bacterium]
MDEVKGVEYRNRSLKKYILLGTFSILIIVIVILLLLIISSRTPNNTLPYPVSKKVAQSLKFDIYYPNQKLL